jgi:hypothetical protein
MPLPARVAPRLTCRRRFPRAWLVASLCIRTPVRCGPPQVAKGQEALEKKLSMLETHQKEIHSALTSIEGEADRIFKVSDFRLKEK